MITVTRDSAELLAQVLPTLLIALAIEARGPRGQFGKLVGALRFGVRAIAIGSTLSATFMCILVATGFPTSTVIEVFVNVAFYSLFFAFVLFINHMLTKEVDES